MRALAIAAAVMLGAYALWAFAYPTNSFRYRLTLEVSVDGKPVTGTGVIEVTVRQQPKVGDVPGHVMDIRGEAVVVDLGSRGLLFALLKGRDYQSQPGQIVYSTFPPQTKHGGGAALPENLRRYQTQILRAELASKQLPLVVRFRDISDPKTVEAVDPSNIAASFGSGISLVRAALETTRDSVTTGIDKKLSWLSTHQGLLDGSRYMHSTSLANNLGSGDFKRSR